MCRTQGSVSTRDRAGVASPADRYYASAIAPGTLRCRQSDMRATAVRTCRPRHKPAETPPLSPAVPTRVALVTGAASGIGAAVCRALAASGVAVVVHTRRNQAGAESVAAAVRAAGAQAETVLGDLTDRRPPVLWLHRAIARFGRLDVLVSNAGFADRTPVAALTDAAMTDRSRRSWGRSSVWRARQSRIWPPHRTAG